MAQFAIAHDQAGMLRAGLAVMAAQDFRAQIRRLSRHRRHLLPRLAGTSYRWLQASTLIEQGECLEGAAKLREAMKANQQGWELAKRFHYPGTATARHCLRRQLPARHRQHGPGTAGATRWSRHLLAIHVSDKHGENLYASLFESS